MSGNTRPRAVKGKFRFEENYAKGFMSPPAKGTCQLATSDNRATLKESVGKEGSVPTRIKVGGEKNIISTVRKKKQRDGVEGMEAPEGAAQGPVRGRRKVKFARLTGRPDRNMSTLKTKKRPV